MSCHYCKCSVETTSTLDYKIFLPKPAISKDGGNWLWEEVFLECMAHVREGRAGWDEKQEELRTPFRGKKH